MNRLKSLNIKNSILLCCIPVGMVCVPELAYILWGAVCGGSGASGGASCLGYALCILIFGGIAAVCGQADRSSVVSRLVRIFPDRLRTCHACKWVRVILLCVAVGLALQICASGIIRLASHILPELIESYTSSINESFSVSLGFLRVFSVIFLAPIAEELAFRVVGLRLACGIPDGRCSEKARFGFATFVTSALFGLYHGNVVQFCYAFVCGLIMAKLDMRCNSVIPSLVIHWTVNASAYLPIFYLQP